MENQTLRAWTYEEDFIPTLYIQGSITSNGEKPIINLEESVPQGFNPEYLILQFSVDVYDPSGKVSSRVNDFSKTLTNIDDYSTVTIKANKGDIHIVVEKRARKNQSASAEIISGFTGYFLVVNVKVYSGIVPPTLEIKGNRPFDPKNIFPVKIIGSVPESPTLVELELSENVSSKEEFDFVEIFIDDENQGIIVPIKKN